MTLLVSLIKTEEEFMNIHNRLKVSGEEKCNGLFVLAHREDKDGSDPVKPYKDLILMVSQSPHFNNCVGFQNIAGRIREDFYLFWPSVQLFHSLREEAVLTGVISYSGQCFLWTY